jgi:hypothetical protein
VRLRRSQALPWAYDDGGRLRAGFAGEAGDCVTRAIAIATGTPYREVYDGINELAHTWSLDGLRVAGTARTGIDPHVYRIYIRERHGWAWIPTMGIGTGCRVHLRRGELPGGRLIARVSKHLCAVVDGTVRDTYDPARDGTRCVYGYWVPGEN